MTYAALLTNSEGKSIVYGYEYIPVCIHAQLCEWYAGGDHNMGTGTTTDIVLPIPYSAEYTFALRLVTTVQSTYEQPFYSPTVTLHAASNGNTIARFHVINHGPEGTCTSKLYIMGRARYPISQYGMVIYADDGKIAFTSDAPPMQINKEIIGNNGIVPSIPSKHTATIPSMFDWYIRDGGGGYSTIEYSSAWACKEGSNKAIGAFSAVVWTPRPYWGGDDHGYMEYIFLSFDTTLADQVYF